MAGDDKKDVDISRERKVCPIDGKEEVGQKPGDVYCHKHGVKLVSPSEAKSSSTRTMAYEKIIFNFILPAIPPLIVDLFIWPLLSTQGIPIYGLIIFVVGYILLYFSIRTHGHLFGIAIAGIAIFGYMIIIGLVNVIVTGDYGIIYAAADLLVPAPWRDTANTGIQTGLQTLKCAFNPLNYQNCITSSSNNGNGNVPKICKPIDQYKFLNIQFGESPDYKLSNLVRNDHIFIAEITIMPNNDYTTSGIIISGELINTTGSVIKMKSNTCLTAAENCQVGPGLPPLSITLRSADKVNFPTNDLAFLSISVSYPVIASGSNTFYIGKSRADVQTELAKYQGPSLGIGPLDSHITFSTNYYLTGSSGPNPDAANIEVYANVINGKKNCYGEEGYGRMAQIKISHTSDIQGITLNCITPDGDSFNEGQSQDVPGTQVTNIQTYTCTFTAPDDIGNTGAKSIIFTSDISYNYTEVKMTQGMSVCPSDTSIPCQ